MQNCAPTKRIVWMAEPAISYQLLADFIASKYCYSNDGHFGIRLCVLVREYRFIQVGL
jgi:hypothetical protein